MPLLGTRYFQDIVIVDKSSEGRFQNSVFYTTLLHKWFENNQPRRQKSKHEGSKQFYTKHLHKLPKGLCTKGGKYHLRKRVPRNVQSKIGKKEIWRSLRTDSLQAARRRLPLISAQVESEIEHARKHTGLSVDEMLLKPLEDDVRRSGAVIEVGFPSLREAYDQYLTDPTHDWSIRTCSSYTTSRNLAATAIGEALLMSELSRAHCRDYMELLRYLPRNAAKRFPRLTPQQAAEKAKADPSLQVISAANANVYLADFSTFLNWAVNEELITHNPVRGLRLPDKVAKRDKRLPFSAEQLKTIFNARLYIGCLDGGRGYATAGHQRPRNARFWVPLIALHTGMRLPNSSFVSTFSNSKIFGC